MPFLAKQSLFQFAVRQWLAMTLTVVMAVPPSWAENRVLKVYSDTTSEAPRGGDNPPAADATKDSLAPTSPEAGNREDGTEADRKGVPHGPLACPDYDTKPEFNNALPSAPAKEVNEWGSITVAQPKIWQFERVSALLDGLLRDVEGVSMTDLTQLNPNAQNAAAVKFVQSALEAGVQFDQSALVTNNILRKNFQQQSLEAQRRFQQDSAYINLLSQERNIQTAQLLAAQNTVNSLQPLADAKTISDAQQKELDAATARVTALKSSLGDINTSLGNASLTSLTAPPSFTSTSLQAPATGADTKSTLTGFSDLLDKLPAGMKSNLSKSFETPTLPATKQLDNFITLLYERLAREVSVLQDDLARSPDNVAYLLQFDVGVYPSKKAKNHNARVEFKINCPDCKVYSLYPGQSSYNLAKFTGASKHTSIWGNIITLLGFGASASYRRQVDTLQGGLTQSVYTVGFQNGVLTPDPSAVGPERTPPDGSGAVQSFGWYYGAAPFEDSVSPGIRTTFAMVTVPRRDIDRARDIFGNSSACMPFHIMSAWGMRDDPMRQRESESVVGKIGREAAWPFYNWSKTDNQHNGIADRGTEGNGREPVFREHPILSVGRSATSVKLPGAPEESSIVAKRERDTLHVLRMEYNTVFEEEENGDSDTESPIVAVSSTKTATSSATTGTGNGVASASTTVSSTTVGDEYSPLAKCAPKQCAGMLLRLDRPVDPNLIITVRGEPLKRVRDWRGRATSVLPPAQSGTDLSSSQVTNTGELGTALIKHLRSSRSLLETDDAEPNSWMALSSTEIFLNISKELATEDEFPVIQLTDSAHSVIIPHELRNGTTDLIINGLHMKPQTGRGLWKGFLATYASDRAVEAFKWYTKYDEPRELSGDSPITSGPYPYTTFVPLFLPDAPWYSQKFYARLGEARDDLMIGMAPDSSACGEARRKCIRWSEGHTQVILEDRDLDFAWSLSCYVQGEELACHLPRPAIQQMYGSYLRVCIDDSFCPGAKESAPPLQRGFATFFQKLDQTSTDILKEPEDQAAAKRMQQVWKEIASNPSGDHEIDEMRRKILVASEMSSTPKAFSRSVGKLSEPTLQVWVVQSDTDADQVFYSAEPARIDFFPLSEEYWTKGSLKAWHFKSADANNIKIEGCNYFPQDLVNGQVPVAPTGHRVTLLGSLFPPKPRALVPEEEEDFHSCQVFNAPAIALVRTQLVFTIAPERGPNTDYPTPFAIPTYKLAPAFSKPIVTNNFERESSTHSPYGFQLTGWTLDFTATRTIPIDTLELPPGLTSTATGGASIKVEWLGGTRELRACDGKEGRPSGGRCTERSAPAADWEKADEAGGLHLRLTIPRELYPYLSEDLHLVRHSQMHGDISVAKLPNLRKLLFPTRLSLEPLSETQFVLRGENAGAISAVALQNGNSSRTFPVAPGTDYALITLPAKSSAAGSGNSQPQKPKPPAPQPGQAPGQQGTQPATSPGTPPAVSTPNPATPPKSPALKPTAFNGGVTGKFLMAAFTQGPTAQRGNAGTTAGAPPSNPVRQNSGSTANNRQAGTAQPAKPATAGQQSSKTPGAGAQKQATDAKPLDPGTYSVLALVQVNAKGKPTEYAPITVKDVRGKPLLWVVPAEPKSTEQKNPDTETKSPSTCPTCVVPACMTCSAPAKTETPKKQ